jgi:dextranase
VIASCGGFHLLLGERDGILCDPYYPKYATLRPGFARTMRAYYDHLVRYQEWLTGPELRDWTEAGDSPVSGPGLSSEPVPGAIWAIARRGPGSRVVHLINLTDQADTAWNAPRTPPSPRRDITLELRGLPAEARALLVSPDLNQGRPVPLALLPAGEGTAVTVPELRAWASLIVLPEPA